MPNNPGLRRDCGVCAELDTIQVSLFNWKWKMAAKGRVRFWLVGVTAFVGLAGLLNSKLTSGAPTEQLHEIVKHHSKRELADVRNATRKPSVYTELVMLQQPSASLYSGGGQLNSQPSAKCPLANPGMRPCVCRPLAKGIIVECTNPHDRNELTNALSNLRTYVMSEAKLTGLDFELMNGDLDQMQFISLQFSRGAVRIKGPADSFSLAHLEHTKTALMSVHFVGCSVDLGETTLSKAPSVLNALEFSEAWFEKPYQERWFKDLRVEQLRIMDSKQIQQKIASQLIGLKMYQHSKCELKTISKDFLPLDKSQLRRLDFSDNQLDSLPEGLFDGIASLEEVLLTSNRFTTINENVFSSVWNYMQKLDVNGNFLLKCEGIAWLRNKSPEERAKVKGTCINADGVEIDLAELTN